MLRTLAIGLSVFFSACLEPAIPPPSSAPEVEAVPYVCGPTTCTGCCRDNVCLGGNHDSACGYDGRQCRVCAGNVRCEAPGACFQKPSDGGTTGRPFNPDAGVNLEVLQRCQFLFGFVFCG